MAGLSRKSTIYKTLGIPAEEAFNGTTVLHTLALQNGANILRVHDVKEAKEAITFSKICCTLKRSRHCWFRLTVKHKNAPCLQAY